MVRTKVHSTKPTPLDTPRRGRNRTTRTAVRGYAHVPLALLTDPSIEDVIGPVWARIDELNATGSRGVCDARRAILAPSLGLSVSHLDRAIRRLAGLGYAAVLRRGRQRSNLLTVSGDDDAFARVPRWVLGLLTHTDHRPRLTPAEWRTYAWLLAQAVDDNGCCWPSYNHVARALSIARRTAVNRIARLAALGLVEILPGSADDPRNRYRVVTGEEEATLRRAFAGATGEDSPGATGADSPGATGEDSLTGEINASRDEPKRTAGDPPAGGFTCGSGRTRARARRPQAAAGPTRRTSGEPARVRPEDVVILPTKVPPTWQSTAPEAIRLVLAKLPPELRAAVPRRCWGVIRSWIRSGLADRSPAELADRIDRRWYTWGYAEQHVRGQIQDPIAVFRTLIAPGICPDPQCEDGYWTALGADGRACPRCEERRAAHFLDGART